MNIGFDSKTVVITGASGAIGSAMARGFAADGAYVAIGDINEELGEKKAAEIRENGGKAGFFRLDVTDKQSISEAMRQIETASGGIDVLINNAGVNVPSGERYHIDRFSDEWWERITSIDLDGVFHCSKAAVPYIRKRGGGSILNISSVIGIAAFRNQCAFSAAKAGVIHLTKAMAVELADDNIRVNSIAPGSICMDLTKSLWSGDELFKALMAHIPQHRQGAPEDITGTAEFLCCDAVASYVTGQVIAVDGGWSCGYARDF